MRALIAAFILLAPLSAVSLAEEWQEVKGTHFIVRYLGSTVKPAGSDYPGEIAAFAADVADRAERYYGRIAADLGYARYSEFWTWDKRVKLYIYPDHAAYVGSSGHPEWSQGMADYAKKEISSYAFSRNFLDSILPHELAHLIFRDFVGFEGEVPRWLDEGVAQWEEEANRPEKLRMVKALYDHGGLLSLAEMMRLNINAVKNDDRLVAAYYVQSVSLVGFLLETYGADEFAAFCRELRDGKTMDEALASAYPLHIRDLDDLEAGWRANLKEKQ